MILSILISAFALGFPFQAVQAGTAAGFSEYYIPGSAAQLAAILYDLDPNQIVSPFSLTNVITISVGADNTTIKYDHWEKGYGNAVETYAANRGSVLTFKSTTLPSAGVTSATTCAGSTNPNGVTAACYDGRDHISVTGGTVSVAQVFWPTSANTLYANAWEIYPVKPYQTSYTLPVGEDLYSTAGSFSDFHKVYVIVEALSDGTNVQINDPTIAGVEVTAALNRGEVTQLWHTHVGTTVTSDKPVQVQFIIGNNAISSYNSRSYTAVPSGLWSSSYFSPVPGPALSGHHTDLFIFNPNGSAMNINFQDSSGGGSFQVAANSTVSYQAKVGRYVPVNSGVSLAAADGVTTFWAIGSTDAGSADYNWGFSLIPANLLTNEYYVSWSPGSSDLNTTTNGSPVYVSPSQDNTTIFVDYGPLDGVVDATYTLNRLQEQKIFDPDKNNTGTHIWATAPIAAVWGEDPDSAPTGSPGIDAGYTLLPFNQNWIDVVSTLKKTANPSSIAAQANQAVTFTISINVGAYGLNNVYVIDALPANWAYIPGSTVITWPGGSSTVDPSGAPGPNLSWGSAGSPLASLAANQIISVVYRAQTTAVPANFSLNTATSIGTYNNYTYTASGSAMVVTTQPDLSVIKTNNLAGSALVGSPFSWNLQVLNGSSSGMATFTNSQVILKDNLPSGPTYGSPAVTVGAIPLGGTGTILCLIASNLLTCTASGGTVILPTGSIFNAAFSVTPAAAVTLVNPTGGVCQVDPNGAITESNEANNNCAANTVSVFAPSMTIAKTASPASGTTVSLGSTIAYTITVNNIVAATQNHVVINDALPAGTTYVAGSSRLAYSMFADNFNAQAYNNNNGSLNFSGNWIESEGGNATGGNFQILQDGAQTYVLQPGNNAAGVAPANGNIYRLAGNMSACTNVYLNYDYRRANALEAGDFLYVDASSNSGGAWTNTVSNITAGSDAAYQASPTIDLTTYKANLGIRFRSVYADNGGVADVDTVYIDNVRLTCSIPVHAPTNMLTAADAINLPAGMSMTLTYSVTVNTPAAAGQTSVVNTASVFSDGQLQPLQSTTTHPLPPTTITGTVYNDLNNSGTFTAGEPGISGVTLTLSTGAATTTDASGNYSFTNLPAGTYSVTETDPSGYVSTGDTQAPNDNMIGSITVTAGGTSAGNNFLDWKPATITGTVYNDQNGSGSFDTGEPGLSGVTVTLRNGAVIVATTTTDSGGNYSFTNLVAGTYSVTETDPAGFTSTGDTQAPNDNNISSIVLAAGATSAGNNFFDWQPATVSGSVYNDLNGDGSLTAGEPGIIGVTVTLKNGATTVATATTIAGGSYSFTNLAAGTYSVTETDPAGFVSTGDIQGSLTDNVVGNITVVAGGASAGNNFFDWQPATVSGTVYNDLNGDASLTSGEPRITGVTVTLKNGVATVATTTTDASGSYSFTSLAAGTYSVTETDPAGFTSTGDTQAPNDNIINSIGLAAGATSAGNNFFDWKPATITGTVYNDLNGNGSYDTGELGLSGATLTLRNGVTTIATAATGSGGTYSFTNLPAGTYSVTETDPPTYISTGDTQGANDNVLGAITVAAGGTSSGNNFFDLKDAAISGTVWMDSNLNGAIDNGETGLANVTIRLYRDNENGTFNPAEESHLGDRPSDTNGNYAFKDLLPGNYWVFVADGVSGYNLVSGGTNPRYVQLSDTDSTGNNFGYAPVDLQVSKTNNTGSTGTVGKPFTWTLTVRNTGSSGAAFNDGQVIVSDPLPANANYEGPAAGAFTSIINSGSIACANSSGTIRCTASGAPVTIGAGGSFQVTFKTTPTETGTLYNTATVDPDNVVAETIESNNTGQDAVTVRNPTAVTITNFSVTSTAIAEVEISWTTAMEIDNLGFNLYRSQSATGPWDCLNPNLIAAKTPGTLFGNQYDLVDGAVQPGVKYYYRLEAINTNSIVRNYGIVAFIQYLYFEPFLSASNSGR